MVQSVYELITRLSVVENRLKLWNTLFSGLGYRDLDDTMRYRLISVITIFCNVI